MTHKSKSVNIHLFLRPLRRFLVRSHSGKQRSQDSSKDRRFVANIGFAGRTPASQVAANAIAFWPQTFLDLETHRTSIMYACTAAPHTWVKGLSLKQGGRHAPVHVERLCLRTLSQTLRRGVNRLRPAAAPLRSGMRPRSRRAL